MSNGAEKAPTLEGAGEAAEEAANVGHLRDDEDNQAAGPTSHSSRNTGIPDLDLLENDPVGLLLDTQIHWETYGARPKIPCRLQHQLACKRRSEPEDGDVDQYIYPNVFNTQPNRERPNSLRLRETIEVPNFRFPEQQNLMRFPDLQLLAHSTALEEIRRPMRLDDSDSSNSEEEFDDIRLETTPITRFIQDIEVVPEKGTDSDNTSDEEFLDCQETDEEEDEDDLEAKIVWLAAITLFMRSHMQHIRLQIRRYVLNVEIIARIIIHYISSNLKVVTGVELVPLKSNKKTLELHRGSPRSSDSEGEEDVPPSRRKNGPKKKTD